jgi:hypothetical protein
MAEDVSDLKTLAKLMEIQFDEIKDQIKDQKEDFKERITKSDAHFDRRIEKLEERFSQEIKDITQRTSTRDTDIAVLQAKVESTSKSWGGFVGMIAGVISSLTIAVITKLLGF